MGRGVFSAIFVAIGAAAALGAAAACGSFDESPDPVGSEAGAADVVTGADGALPADATTDADAGVRKGKCVGTDLVAADTFMRPLATGTGWSVLGTSPPTIDDSFGLAAPSLYAVTGPLGADAGASTQIGRTIGLSGNPTVCIDLDLYYAQPSGTFTDGSYAEILQIDLEPNAHYVEMVAAGFSFANAAKRATYESFKRDTWQHVTVRLPFTTGRASLQLDDDYREIDPPLGPAPPTLVLQLGIQADGMSGTAGAVRINVDNFHVTAE